MATSCRCKRKRTLSDSPVCCLAPLPSFDETWEVALFVESLGELSILNKTQFDDIRCPLQTLNRCWTGRVSWRLYKSVTFNSEIVFCLSHKFK